MHTNPTAAETGTTRAPVLRQGGRVRTGIAIDRYFPAGNIVLDDIAGDDALVRQDLREIQCDRFCPSGAATYRLVPGWSDGLTKIALGFHRPARKGEEHEPIHVVAPNHHPDRFIWPGMQALSQHPQSQGRAG